MPSGSSRSGKSSWNTATDGPCSPGWSSDTGLPLPRMRTSTSTAVAASNVLSSASFISSRHASGRTRARYRLAGCGFRHLVRCTPMGLADRATASGGALHRLAQRPMWQHALALLVLLTVLIPVIGTGGQFHDDEGAATLQAHMLAEGEGWLRPYEVHGFDPGYVHPSIFAADLRTAGYAPYGKHPAYPLLLVPFAKVGGVAGLLFTSVLGAVAAALVAGEIGERLRPGSRAVVFWAAALGSPLFFDGLIVEAHTIAAALAGAAVLALFAFFDRPRWTASFAALAALLGVGLLRTEGILFSVAAGIAVILVAIWRHRRAAVTLGAGLVVLGAAIRLLEPRAAGAVLPSTAAHVRDHLRAGGTFVSRRVAGAVTGLVQGGYQWVSVGFALSTLAAVLLLATIVVARRRPADTDGIALFAFAAAAVFVLRALIASSGAIPGLLLTSPIIVAGLAFVRCRSFTSDRHRLSV